MAHKIHGLGGSHPIRGAWDVGATGHLPCRWRVMGPCDNGDLNVWYRRRKKARFGHTHIPARMKRGGVHHPRKRQGTRFDPTCHISVVSVALGVTVGVCGGTTPQAPYTTLAAWGPPATGRHGRGTKKYIPNWNLSKLELTRIFHTNSIPGRTVEYGNRHVRARQWRSGIGVEYSTPIPLQVVLWNIATAMCGPGKWRCGIGVENCFVKETFHTGISVEYSKSIILHWN